MRLMGDAKKKSFVSRLGKHGKDFVERVSAKSRDLGFDEHIAKCWSDAVAYSDRSRRGQLESCENLKKRCPSLTDEQVDQMFRLLEFAELVEYSAVARRAAFDDPAELVMGLRLAYRTFFAIRGRWRNRCDLDQLLPMCAVGDIEIARQVAKGRRGACSAVPHSGELVSIATVAWLNEDTETQEIVVQEIEAMSMKYVKPWDEAVLRAFCAAHHSDADGVANQICNLLTSIKKLREKTDISHVIILEAHGLYRLLESGSPELVQSFDVTQGFPWDPEVHAWCDENPSSAQTWDLTGLSKDLHQIVVKRKVPSWLPKLEFYQVELLEADPTNPDVVTAVDGKMSSGQHDPMTVINACPVVFLYEYELETAEDTCRRLNMSGCKARVSKQKAQPYRPIVSR